MAETEQRRLAAIMFTDIVGYTQRSEAHALELLDEHACLLRGLFRHPLDVLVSTPYTALVGKSHAG